MALGGGSVALPLNQHLNSASRTLAKTPIEGQYFLDGNQLLQDIGTTPVSPLANAADGNPATSATVNNTDYNVNFSIRGTATPLTDLISGGFIASAETMMQASVIRTGIGITQFFISMPFTLYEENETGLNQWWAFAQADLDNLTSFNTDLNFNLNTSQSGAQVPGQVEIRRAIFKVTETMV